MPNAYINGVLTEVTDEDVAATRYSPPPTEGEIRSKRDELIASTDTWALSDRTMTAEQTAYRQALRDITGQAGFPTNITWPTKP
tara:strand:- start:10 stop:261 length:252 start_codon:yes stop_codon:yes gene_type:complete